MSFHRDNREQFTGFSKTLTASLFPTPSRDEVTVLANAQ